MAEEWLKRLVHEIKEKDHAAAEGASRSAHEQRIIDRDGPALWRAFGDFLCKYVEEMTVEFGRDVTLSEGELSCGANPQNATGQMSITKTAFPYVNFTANPNYLSRSAVMMYAVRNPQAPQGQPIAQVLIPCRFEVSHDDKIYKIYFQLDGKPFHEPQEAAKYIIEKLFTLPA